jgi:hypothetical protein
MAVEMTSSERAAKLLVIGENVRTLLSEVVSNITSMINDLRENKLTDVSTAMVAFANTQIAKANVTELMKNLIVKHKHWNRVLDRDNKFFTQDITELLSKMPDVEILKVPLTVYEKHKSEQFKNYPPGEDKFPIQVIDFDSLWVRFTRIIQGACSYNRNSLNPDPIISGYAQRVNELVAKDKKERPPQLKEGKNNPRNIVD